MLCCKCRVLPPPKMSFCSQDSKGSPTPSAEWHLSTEREQGPILYCIYISTRCFLTDPLFVEMHTIYFTYILLYMYRNRYVLVYVTYVYFQYILYNIPYIHWIHSVICIYITCWWLYVVCYMLCMYRMYDELYIVYLICTPVFLLYVACFAHPYYIAHDILLCSPYYDAIHELISWNMWILFQRCCKD